MKKYLTLLITTAAVGTLLFLLPILSPIIIPTAEYIYPTVKDVNNYSVCSGVISNDDGILYVTANISENDIPYVALGQTAEITGNALGKNIYTGKVSYVSQKASKIQSGTTSRTVIKCHIKIVGDTSELKEGYNVTAKIVTDTEKNAMILPFDTVMTEGNNNYIYVINGANAEKRYIETDGEIKDGYIISVGVDTDTKVVYNPTEYTSEKLRVTATARSEEY